MIALDLLGVLRPKQDTRMCLNLYRRYRSLNRKGPWKNPNEISTLVECALITFLTLSYLKKSLTQNKALDPLRVLL